MKRRHLSNGRLLLASNNPSIKVVIRNLFAPKMWTQRLYESDVASPRQATETIILSFLVY